MDQQQEFASSEFEYEKALSYIFHMYDTRHKIFQFAVSMNTVLLAVVIQYIELTQSKFLISSFAALITIAISLMGVRSWQYLNLLEEYTAGIEVKLGFALLGQPASRMPKGIDSSQYLFLIYLLMSVLWLALSVGYLANLMGFNIPMP